MNYVPIFNQECNRCGTEPCVGIQDQEILHSAVRSTGLCGPHFFQDRLMSEWELWNDEPESTE